MFSLIVWSHDRVAPVSAMVLTVLRMSFVFVLGLMVAFLEHLIHKGIFLG